MKLSYALLLCPLLFGCQTTPRPDETKDKSTLAPKLTKPVVRRVWIPEKIEDDGRS